MNEEEAYEDKRENEAAADKETLAGGDCAIKLQEAQRLGLQHGAYEGDELQLPATFVTDSDGMVLYVRYGTNAADVPSMRELKELLANDISGYTV